MTAKHKTPVVAPPAPEVKKPAPEGQEFQGQETQFETAAPTAMRKALADPGRMSGADIRTAQRAYGNQFVQRLARGTTISGVRAGKPAGGTVSRKGGSKPLLQRSGDGAAPVHSSVESRIESQRGAGQPLLENTQEQMSDSFGADFSGVRVHTGGESNQLNRSLNARAFTTGQDVYFADNEYNPNSSGGQELIAHELTHVVQQGGAPAKSKAQTKSADEDEGLVATKPLQRGMADEEQEQLLTKPLEGTPIQRAMTVNAPGDEYEQEADSTAKQVMSKSAQRAAVDDEDENMVATKPVQLDHLPEEEEAPGAMTQRVQTATRLQREEKKEESDDEKKKKEEANAEKKGEEAKGKSPTDKKDEKKEGDKKEGDKKEGEAKKEGAPAAGGGAAGGGGAPGGGTPAAKPKTPEEAEAQQAQGQLQAAAIGRSLSDQLGFNVTKPPEWDSEVSMHQMFKSLAGGGAGDDAGAGAGAEAVQTKPAVPSIQRIGSSVGGTVMAEAEGKAPEEKKDSSKWAGGEFFTEKKPGQVVPVPKHENVIAQVVIGDTIGKAAEATNTFVGAFTGQEKTPFGFLAAIMETAIMISEIITSILGYISLAMLIVSAILYGIGTALVASLFGAAAGAVLLAWASTLLGWSLTLGTWATIITAYRFVARPIVMLFRILDLVTGTYTEEEKKERQQKLIGQAIAWAADGVSLVLAGQGKNLASPGVAAEKIAAENAEKQAALAAERAALSAGTEALEGATTDAAKAGAKAALGTAAKTGAKAGAQGAGQEILTGTIGVGATLGGNLGGNAAQTKSRDGSGPDKSAIARDDIPPTGGEGGGQPAKLTEPPLGAAETVDDLSIGIGTAEAEKAYLMSRIATIDEIIGEKTVWSDTMSQSKKGLQTHRGALEQSNKMSDTRAAKMGEAAEKSKEAADKSKDAQAQSSSANSGLSSMKGPIDQGAEKAKDKGVKVEGDPNQTQGGMGKNAEAAGQTGAAATTGAADAAAKKKESEAIKAESTKTIGKVNEADKKVDDAQGKNQSEIEMLRGEKQAALERLAVVDGKENELKAQHAAALAETFTWVETHKAERAAAGVGMEGGAGVEGGGGAEGGGASAGAPA
jgi:hypothetical protein